MKELTANWNNEIIFKELDFARFWNDLQDRNEATGRPLHKKQNYLVCIFFGYDGSTSVHPFETLKEACEFSSHFGNGVSVTKIVKVC